MFNHTTDFFNGLLAQFLGYEFEARKRANTNRLERKIEHTSTDSIEEQITILRDLGPSQALVRSLSVLASFWYQTELRREHDRQALDLLREAEKIARQAGLSRERLHVIVTQVNWHWKHSEDLEALHLHSIAFLSAIREADNDAQAELCFQAGAFALQIQDPLAEDYIANGFRILRDQGYLERLAIWYKAIGEIYLRSGLAQRKAWCLLQEALRLDTILGRRDEKMTRAVEEMRNSGILGATAWSPSPEDLFCGPTTWPLAPLGPGERTSGRRHPWWRVSPSVIEWCKSDERACMAVFGIGEAVNERLDLGYAWDGLFFLLSKDRRTGSSALVSNSVTPSDPELALAITGNRVLNERFDCGYGTLRYLSEAEVKAVAKRLRSAVEDWEGFASLYDGQAMDDLKVYPHGWEEGKWFLAGDLQNQLMNLRDFYCRASEESACVVSGIWGPSCEGDLVQQRAAIGRWLAERKSKVSGNPDYKYWYIVTDYGPCGRDFELTCQRCGQTYDCDPSLNDRVPVSCHGCGLRGTNDDGVFHSECGLRRQKD